MSVGGLTLFRLLVRAWTVEAWLSELLAGKDAVAEYFDHVGRLKIVVLLVLFALIG